MIKEPAKPKGYFENIYCIYLDQFAVSNLVQEDPTWMNLKQLIEVGVSKGRIICPIPTEHFIETSGKRDEEASKHHDYLVSLSGNFVFRHIAFISAQLMISDIRKNNITKHTFLDSLKPSFSFEKSVEKWRSIRAEYETMFEESTTNSNIIRDAIRGTKIPSDQQPVLANVTTWLIVGQFINRLQELVDTGEIQIRGVKFVNREVSNWIDYTLDVLMKKNKMKTAEAKKLLRRLKDYGFSHISTLNTRYTLESYLAVHHKKQTANDEIDIQRIAAAIQISDIMLVDRARKFELEETGLAEKYGTSVYCGVQKDIRSLEEVLTVLTA